MYPTVQILVFTYVVKQVSLVVYCVL
jgi:hypothetical protein